jgi:succinate dehydrogenase/fumarate reductase flavoprotein subunit
MKNKREETHDMNEVPVKKGITRRDFLKGAAVGAVGIATMGLFEACTPKSETNEPKADATSSATEADTGKSEIPAFQGTSGQPSFLTAPDPIPESKIIKTVDTEVLVIGAGFGGVATACSAAEQGAKVVVVEKTGKWNGRGGGAGVLDSKFMRKQGLKIDKAKAKAEWVRTCGSRVDESVISTFFNRSGEAMDWLLDKAEAEHCAVMIWGGYSRSKSLPDEPGYHMIMGGDSIKEGEFAPVALLYNASVKAGVEYVFNAPAEQLVKDGDKVVGVVVKTADGYVRYNASKGVVLATGDIAADSEMLSYYAPIALKAVESQYTPAGVNTGDGHKMGIWAGAVMQDGPLPTMIHPQAYAWFHGPFMFVNNDGKRFFNEATWVQAKSLNIMAQKSGNVAYSVFDGNWLNDLVKGLPEGGGMFWDSFRPVGAEFDTKAQQATIDGYIEQGLAFKANSLEELADKIGVNKENFLTEVKRYNSMCEAGEDTDFFKEKIFLTPIKKGPFYATKVGPALLAIVGGLITNADMQCLDAEGQPISGLYAVGNTAGSANAVDYPINVPGNSHGRCLTYGYVVGQNLAKM